MSKNKIFLIAALCAILAGSLTACSSHYGYHDRDRYDRDGYYGGGNGYRSDREAYDYGYRRGYEHGVTDRRNRENFDYDHDDLFRRGISRDRSINERFRQGYARGYEAGYRGSYHRY